MQTVQLLAFFSLFIMMAVAMFFRKIPALLALPLMAFFIPLIGGVSLTDTVQYVMGEGALKLHYAYTVALFGSMLSILLQKTGVAENFIKKGAELAGDKPWSIAVLMLLLITSLFTTLGGLGAIIMVATIILPILSSIGVGSATVVGIFLIGLSLGGIMNAGNWAVYIDVMGLTVQEIRPFALIMFGITFIMALVYISVQLYRDGHEINLKKIPLYILILLFILTSVLLWYTTRDESFKSAFSAFIQQFFLIGKYLIGVIMTLLFFAAFFHFIRNLRSAKSKIYWTAYYTPLLPLLLILIFDMNFIAAFICGLIFGFLSTYRKGSINVLVQSILEGGALVMPAVALMLGIGMLLNAIMGPVNNWPAGWPVLNLLQPLLQHIVPPNGTFYVLLFGLLAPLALYRGPLNIWGMGYGLAAVLLASGMKAGAVMGLLLAVGQVQGISDPTNTHNVWLANEMQQDVQKILWNTIPYSWAIAVTGLIAAAWMFY